MAYATADDVRHINGFPTENMVGDPLIDGWCADFSAEADLIFLRAGVAVPITAPAALLALLKNMVVYGAASMLESAPVLGMPPDAFAASVNLYLEEYKRRKAELVALTTADYIRLGLLTAAALTDGGAAVGLSAIGNWSVDPNPLYPPYLNAYPFRQPGQG